MAAGLTRKVICEALSGAASWDGGGYLDALTRALDDALPNFETPRYQGAFREQAVDRDWFASLLASNLYMEGYSAGRLKQYSGVISGDGTLQRDLARHAHDEARHSLQFYDLLFLVFPHLDTPTLRREAKANVVDLDAITPCPADYPAPSSDELLNSLILMNLFEIKALYLGNYLRPFVRAHAPAAQAREAEAIICGIAGDECHHIAYTARHIDAYVRELGADAVASLMSGFIEQMNGSDDFHL